MYKFMNKHIRSDLALELNEDISDVSGDNGISVEINEDNNSIIKETIIRIHNENGERLLGKPQGTYITIEGDKLNQDDEGFHKVFSDSLRHILKKMVGDYRKILVVGLGNRMVTPDALGPYTVDNLYVTRHLLSEGIIKKAIEISAINPGVMAQTGIETKEILLSLIERIKPDIVIAVDALAAREPSRLWTTIQVCDTGISPGSGVGNDRARLDYETLGVKVIAIGVPTVISVPAIVNQAMDSMIGLFLNKSGDGSFVLSDEEKYSLSCELLDEGLVNMFVTPKNVDEAVKRISYTISEAINSFVEL